MIFNISFQKFPFKRVNKYRSVHSRKAFGLNLIDPRPVNNYNCPHCYIISANEPFKAKLNEDLVCKYEEMLGNAKAGGTMFPVVDARSEERFDGGHVPHSNSIPFMECFDKGEQIMKDPVQLKELFEEKGVDLSKSFTSTCGSGVTACIIAFAAHLCGNKDVSVYDGSWTEWGQRAPPEMIEKTAST